MENEKRHREHKRKKVDALARTRFHGCMEFRAKSIFYRFLICDWGRDQKRVKEDKNSEGDLEHITQGQTNVGRADQRSLSYSLFATPSLTRPNHPPVKGKGNGKYQI